MSTTEYDKLFHEASLAASTEMDKSFDELQQEDLAKGEKDKKEKAAKDKEERLQKNLRDPLDREDGGQTDYARA